MLNGTLNFSWPQPSAYYDVVFIQDTSESFAPYMGEVQAALHEMVDMLMLSSEPGLSSCPRDRVMFVNFGGSQGDSYTYTNGTTSAGTSLAGTTVYTSYNILFEVDATALSANGNAIHSDIDNLSNNIVGDATPTVDALRLAQSAYEDALLPLQHAYNNAEYTVTINNVTYPKTRRTVYVLITDGLADTSTYTDMPTGALPLVSPVPASNRDYAYTWYREELERDYFLYYWAKGTAVNNVTYIPYDASGVAGKAVPYRSYSDGITTWYLKDPSHYYLEPGTGNIVHDYGFYTYFGKTLERIPSLGGIDYATQLRAMDIIASELKSTGGVLDASKDGPAYLVTGFWEPDPDLMAEVDFFGYQYLSTVRPTALSTLQKMASTAGMFVTNTDIDTFT